ncbi:MAG: glucose-1-phosphate adenylyltransferase subunit GlgD [Candidatus Atribacteria bacterium]|nr:glucose-1-phosphate adenylyltransferase subunit GlgD [Candidatus Atribacteria bacterium]
MNGMSIRFALILAGGKGNHLSVLSIERAKAAVPFGGFYRLIDFPLSNCVNSGIYDVGILTQYQPRSLIEHIGVGRPWDMDRKKGGIELLQPYLGKTVGGWYRGTGDAIYQNLNIVQRKKLEHLLVLSGDHAYMMDYNFLMDYHLDHDADITLVVTQVKSEDRSRFGIVEIDENNRVIGFEEKPSQPKTNIAFMGIYVFRFDFLNECLQKNVQESKYDLVNNVIIENLNSIKIQAFFFDGCWFDIGTIKAYWEANMHLLEPLPCFNLYDPNWVIYTNRPQNPPAKIGKGTLVQSSIIGEGTVINGEVVHSVVFPGVVIEKGAKIYDSIIFNDSTIKAGSLVERSVLDKNVIVGEGSIIGTGDDYTPNRLRPDILNWGVNLVGKNSQIPPHSIIPRNCLIGINIPTSGFGKMTELKSGSVIMG